MFVRSDFGSLFHMSKQPTASSPGLGYSFPSLYFARGLPYIIINTVSVILYKKMGIDNASIAFWTSWLYLPWVVKMFWRALVDIYSKKREWILSTRFSMAVCLFVTAYVLNTEGYFSFLSQPLHFGYLLFLQHMTSPPQQVLHACPQQRKNKALFA